MYTFVIIHIKPFLKSGVVAQTSALLVATLTFLVSEAGSWLRIPLLSVPKYGTLIAAVSAPGRIVFGDCHTRVVRRMPSAKVSQRDEPKRYVPRGAEQSCQTVIIFYKNKGKRRPYNQPSRHRKKAMKVTIRDGKAVNRP